MVDGSAVAAPAASPARYRRRHHGSDIDVPPFRAARAVTDNDRRMRLWAMMVERADGRPVTVEHVCRLAASTTATDSVALVLWLAAIPRETVFASDGLATTVEEIALTVGEGPCADAGIGSLVLVPDLADLEYQARWPAFAPAAAVTGIRAVFSLPLRMGGIRLGSMNLYRLRPGKLLPAQLRDALILADAACALLLDSAKPAPDGDGPRRLWDGPQHPEVHQATGMISVQLGVSAAVAFARLRAHAFAQERRLRDVARDVVARRLRFAPEEAGDSNGL